MRSFSMSNVVSLIAITASMAASIAFAENALVDPTRPSGYSESAATQTHSSEKLKLSLIRLGSEPHAVINGTTVAPGESIAGHRLLSLQTSSAILSGPNGRTVLQLAPTIRKSSSTNSMQNR